MVVVVVVDSVIQPSNDLYDGHQKHSADSSTRRAVSDAGTFFPRNAMLARVLAMTLCLSVCLSQVGVLSKRLNESS